MNIIQIRRRQRKAQREGQAVGLKNQPGGFSDYQRTVLELMYQRH